MLDIGQNVNIALKTVNLCQKSTVYNTSYHQVPPAGGYIHMDAVEAAEYVKEKKSRPS